MVATLVGAADNGDDRFRQGFYAAHDKAKHPDLTDEQKKMVRFTGRSFGSHIDRDYAIKQKFDMTPVDYFRKLEEVKDHPGLSKNMRTRLQDMYASTPGPQKGGAEIYGGHQFTHGTMW